jgi:hypothetical protein
MTYGLGRREYYNTDERVYELLDNVSHVRLNLSARFS